MIEMLAVRTQSDRRIAKCNSRKDSKTQFAAMQEIPATDDSYGNYEAQH
jgi:hypothetical protein